MQELSLLVLKVETKMAFLKTLAVATVMTATAASALGTASAQETSKLQQVLDRGYLVLGTGSTNPPWHFVDSDNKLKGFDVDMGRLVAKALFGDPDKIEKLEAAKNTRSNTDVIIAAADEY